MTREKGRLKIEKGIFHAKWSANQGGGKVEKKEKKEKKILCQFFCFDLFLSPT